MIATMNMPSEGQGAEQLREISRRRRDLEHRLADAEEDFAAQQEAIRTLNERLLDTTDESAEEEIRDARQRLRGLATGVANAEAALREWNDTNPTEDQIAAKEAEIIRQEEDRQKAIVYELFRTNLRQRIDTLFALKKLEDEAQALFDGFVARFHLPSAGMPTVARIHAGLLNFIPASFWNLSAVRPKTPGAGLINGRYLIAPSQYLGQALEAIEYFDSNMISVDGTLAPTESEAEEAEPREAA